MAAAKKSRTPKPGKAKRAAPVNPELDALAAAHGADVAPDMDPPPPVEPEPAPAPVEDARDGDVLPPEAAPASSAEFVGIVSGIGFIVCHRAGVSPLNADEVAMIADPLARLAAFYGFKIDGKVGAWLGFGGAVAAVYMARLPEIEARRAAAPQGQAGAADASAPDPRAADQGNVPPGFNPAGPIAG